MSQQRFFRTLKSTYIVKTYDIYNDIIWIHCKPYYKQNKKHKQSLCSGIRYLQISS